MFRISARERSCLDGTADNINTEVCMVLQVFEELEVFDDLLVSEMPGVSAVPFWDKWSQMFHLDGDQSFSEIGSL